MPYPLICLLTGVIFMVSLLGVRGCLEAAAAYSQPLSAIPGGARGASAGYDNYGTVGESFASRGNGSTAYSNETGLLADLIREGVFGAYYTLFVRFNPAATGSGYVTVAPSGLSGNTDFQLQAAQGTPVTLSGTPSQYSLFSGWSGAGCGAGADCGVTLNGDTTVTASFNLDTAHQIMNPGTGSYFQSLQAAYDGAATGAVINTWGITYRGTLICREQKGVTFKGGYNQGYSANGGYTVLDGTLIVGSGKVTVERLLLR